MERYDVVVIGAGAAGLMCAGVAGQRGARVLVLDQSDRLAEKIRISGGGRCNFTNLQADRPERFISEDLRFVRDLLRAYPPAKFIELVRRHRIDYHEKHRGQLFCDDSSEQIIELLRQEMAAGKVTLRQGCATQAVRAVARTDADDGSPGESASDTDSTVGRAAGRSARYELDTSAGTVRARHVVIASGGLSIPAIGASDFGYRIARQFGLRIVEPRPALVPLRFAEQVWAPFVPLAGLSLEVDITVSSPLHASGTASFREDLLFTHRGLSGPAILQISSYWRPGEALTIDLAAGQDIAGGLLTAKQQVRQQTETVLATWLPKRLASGWLAQSRHADLHGRKVAEIGNRRLEELARDLRRWSLQASGSEGFRKAEVTVGGVATDELDVRTLAAHKAPGLHFIGEVVDVTGWLGGYNFQWAWASGMRAGLAVSE